MIKIDIQNEELEKQMNEAIKKLPMEMKKIKLVLWVLKKINSVKKSKLNILKGIIFIYIVVSLFLLLNK
ncbi:hypothetical protein PM10SUCC1_37110 [Propionigenium maris DSM 9537]|uniref:Uncharacterized protein n=1 Tax=Propionigenium maris DSM 9537 TaxID=1123000 RepID=A0A9W6GQC6_9FUSO|nr:hypothetical protein PM10SUCC1_37110 [Propionigenium maris DSM 9537]